MLFLQSVTPTAEEVRTDPRLEKVLGAILSGARKWSAHTSSSHAYMLKLTLL